MVEVLLFSHSPGDRKSIPFPVPVDGESVHPQEATGPPCSHSPSAGTRSRPVSSILVAANPEPIPSTTGPFEPFRTALVWTRRFWICDRP